MTVYRPRCLCKLTCISETHFLLIIGCHSFSVSSMESSGWSRCLRETQNWCRELFLQAACGMRGHLLRPQMTLTSCGSRVTLWCVAGSL